MKTGEWIKQRYESEINRIMAEIEGVIPEILAEKEILELFANMRAMEESKGECGVQFWRGGLIYFNLTVWAKGLIIDVNKGVDNITYCIPEDTQPSLRRLKLQELKKIHPKRWAEVLRAEAKRFFLSEKIELFGEEFDLFPLSGEEAYKEKHDLFLELIKEGNELLYVVKDEDTVYYDLVVVVKDAIPIALPVPILNKMLEIPKDDNTLYKLAIRYDNDKISLVEADTYEEVFETFYKVRNL